MQIFTLRVWRNAFSRKWVRTNESNQPRLALHWLRDQCNCHGEWHDLHFIENHASSVEP
ncbi:hypothetical protein [Photobacterium leiognathi]|uniref:hypothetical protein n=1 Tax=Photobacterium leiognathi TaxID=553611 RepID=UPI002980AC59|nr:hypothetical protein [Photobacterium leiognathi]